MKKIWQSYFYWNKTERRGIIPLLLILFILIGLNLYFRFTKQAGEPSQDEAFLKYASLFDRTEEDEFTPDTTRFQQPKRSYDFANSKPSKFKTPTEKFNPNELSADAWVMLGLSKKQADVILRYKQNGGAFYRKEDLKKMYVISDEFYTVIEPFLVFPTKENTSRLPEKQSISKIDINQADSTQLISLPGINPKLAHKIVDLRTNIGGLATLEDIKNLKGFYEGNYTKLQEKAFAGTIQIHQVNLNYCTFKELMQVPGLEYEQVKGIMNHRQRNGFFEKTEDLVRLNLAEPDLYAKIAPYLTVK